AYILYIVLYAFFKKNAAPPVTIENASETKKKQILNAFIAIIPPLVLIVLVLGSIFGGVATPTESAAVGGIGAILLSVIYREFTFKLIFDSALETVKITAMVFGILIGATAFSMVFTYTGGDIIVEEFMLGLPGEKWGFLILSMAAILVLGFFIDFIEISYIIVPILVPIAENIGINPIWFAILIAMNLQTSFMTPPFGFSLFYLKGVAPPEVKTWQIYKGVVPFIIIQAVILILIVVFPEFFGLSKTY
ncbi:MAG: TRAP transporter large permease subunit, partial [Desulfotignum sp.]